MGVGVLFAAPSWRPPPKMSARDCEPRASARISRQISRFNGKVGKRAKRVRNERWGPSLGSARHAIVKEASPWQALPRFWTS